MELVRLVFLILLDTVVLYWIEIIGALLVAAIGVHMRNLCVVMLAHAGLTVWILHDETTAQVPDRDFVFIMGAVLRLLIANAVVAATIQVFRMFRLLEKNTTGI